MRPDGSNEQTPTLRTVSDGLGRRVLTFAGLPFLSLLVPFLFLPVLARLAGADAWLAIALGQSVGGFGALLVALGYNTVGPTLVARAAPAERPEILRRSLAPRALLFVPVAALGAVIAALIAPDSHRAEAALMAVALTLFGTTPTWYLVGLGRALTIVLIDIVPRLAATAGAAAVLVLSGSALAYPLLLIVVTLVAGGGYVMRVVGLRGAAVVRAIEVRATVREHASATAIELAGGAYNALAVSFVGVAASAGQAASYVSGDKLYRIGQYAVSALGNALQGWAVQAGLDSFARRVRQALVAHAVLGLLGLGAFALLGPVLSAWLFGPEVQIDEPTALGLGVAVLMVSLGTGIGRIYLVAVGARREFLVSVLIAAAIGVPSIILMAGHLGAAGGAWGLAIGESVSVILQSSFAWRARRRGLRREIPLEIVPGA